MSNKQRQQKNKKQQQRLEMEEGEDKNTHTEKSTEEKATNELERMEDDEEEVEEKEEKDTVMQSEEEEDDDDDDDDDELPTFHKGLKFRNYRPRDPDLEKYMLEKVVVPNLSKEISDKLTRLENAKDDDVYKQTSTYTQKKSRAHVRTYIHSVQLHPHFYVTVVFFNYRTSFHMPLGRGTGI